MKQRKITKFVNGGLILILLMMSACSLLPQNKQSNQTGGPTQITLPVVRGSVPETINFVGNVSYSQSAELTWKTNGVIGEVRVKLGDQVKKGDILAVLETDSLNTAVLTAEDTMIQKEEALEDVKESTSAEMDAYQKLNQKEQALKTAKLEQEALYYPRATDLELRVAWDNYALANLNFNYAKQEYDNLVANNASWIGEDNPRIVQGGGWRGKVINGDSGSSARERKYEEYVATYNELVSTYENFTWLNSEPSAVDYSIAEGNVRVAQVEYDEALQEYLSYANGPREKDIMAAEVAFKSAETDFNKRYIIAQFDGTVTSISAIENYYVVKNDAAIRVDDMSRMFVPIDVPELDMVNIHVGMPATISLDTSSGKTYSGTVYSVSDSSTTANYATTFPAKVEFDHPDSSIHAGMTAEVSIDLGSRDNVLLIPASALQYDDGNPYVIALEADQQVKRNIQIGTMTGAIAEITSGNLPEGTKILVNNITPQTLIELGLNPQDYLVQPEGMGQMFRNGSNAQPPQSADNSAQPSQVAPDQEMPMPPADIQQPPQNPMNGNPPQPPTGESAPQGGHGFFGGRFVPPTEDPTSISASEPATESAQPTAQSEHVPLPGFVGG